MSVLKFILFFILILINFPSFAQNEPIEIPDDPYQIYEVWMKDNRLFEGKIETLDRGKILLKSTLFGNEIVSILDVKSIRPLYRIDYEKKKLFIGRKKVILKDSTAIVGKATQQRSNYFVIVSDDGQRYLLDYNEVEKIKDMPYFKTKEKQLNSNYANYLFSPSGYTIQQGQVDFHSKNLYFNAIEIGIMDWLSMSVGADVGFANSFRFKRPFKDKTYFFGSLKASYKASDKWNVAFGSYFMRPNSNWDLLPDSTTLMPFLINTFGNKETNISFGVSLPKQKQFTNRPIYTFSGIARVLKQFALITDNWIKPVQYVEKDLASSKMVEKYEPHLSLGIRYLGRRLSLDIGGTYRGVGPTGTGQSYQSRDLALGVFFGLKYQLR